MKIILQKFIADSGYCSRRQAEELIKQNINTNKKPAILVNGQPAEPGMRVDENDEILIFGKKIGAIKEKIYIKLNKPAGYVCTNRQFENEQSVFDLLPIKEKLFVVGRLDKESRGLILITNDGELGEKLAHPRFEHEKEYEAKLKLYRDDKDCENIAQKFKRGVNIGVDGVVKAKDVKYLGQGKFKIILTYGRKRQIRRMFEVFGCIVEDLVRTRIESLKIGELKEGSWEKLSEEEIKNLFNSVK